MEPKTSGVHTRRFHWCALSPCSSARNVLTLKNSVPASWTTAASQSMRPGSHNAGQPGGRPRVCCAVRAARETSRSCAQAPAVKRSEPAKNVTPIQGPGADAHCDATDAAAKQKEPSAKSVASVPVEPALRCARDRHVTTDPSG